MQSAMMRAWNAAAGRTASWCLGLVAGLIVVCAMGGCGKPAGELDQARMRVRQHPNSVEALLELGREYYDRELYNDAFRVLKTAAAQDPRDIRVLQLWARTTLRLGDTPRAARICESVLQIDPDHVGCRATLGRIYALSGRHDEAIAQLERALNAEPRNLDIAIDLAYAYAAGGQFRNAWQTGRSFTRDHPNSARAHYVYGDMLLRADSPKAAQRQFEAALQLDSDHYLALLQLALLLAVEDGDYERVADLARSADRVISDSPEAQALQAWALVKRGRLVQGLRQLAQVADTYRDNYNVLYLFALALAEAGREEHAQEAVAYADTLERPPALTASQLRQLEDQIGDSPLVHRQVAVRIPGPVALPADVAESARPEPEGDQPEDTQGSEQHGAPSAPAAEAENGAGEAAQPQEQSRPSNPTEGAIDTEG